MYSFHTLAKALFAVCASLLVTACTDPVSESVQKLNSEPQAAQNDVMPTLTVYKNPSCGCCDKWTTHMQAKGFNTTTVTQNNLAKLKASKGIPPQYQSCHTAISKEGYVFEGHVPARFIQQFLKQQPNDAIGLAVPAMPVGSPGMEQGDKFMPYTILLLKADGSVANYAQINTQEEQYQ